MNEEDFRFVALVSDPQGKNPSFKAKSVVLDIREMDEDSDRWLKDIWDKMRQSASNYYKNNGIQPGWVNWKPHEWSKAKVEGRQKYVAWAGNVVAGFIFLRTDFQSHYDPSKSIMYLENIAAAPGNLQTPLWSRRLGYVGRALLAFAVFQSVKQEMGGVLGLHVADDNAQNWYAELDKEANSTLFRPSKIGVPAPNPHQAENRPYLEMTEEGCMSFLEGYRYG